MPDRRSTRRRAQCRCQSKTRQSAPPPGQEKAKKLPVDPQPVESRDAAVAEKVQQHSRTRAAMSTPAPVPSTASSADSVKSCRTSRPRAAPSAVRTRISPRDAACTTSRLVMFAHASSNSRAYCAEQHPHGVPETSARQSTRLNGAAWALHPAFDSGCESDIWRAISRSSPPSWASVAPGASRPMTAISCRRDRPGIRRQWHPRVGPAGKVKSRRHDAGDYKRCDRPA